MIDGELQLLSVIATLRSSKLVLEKASDRGWEDSAVESSDRQRLQPLSVIAILRSRCMLGLSDWKTDFFTSTLDTPAQGLGVGSGTTRDRPSDFLPRLALECPNK